jgi:hypothetical protein
VYFGMYPQTFYKTILQAMDNTPEMPPSGPFKVVAEDNQEPTGGRMSAGILPRPQASIYNVEPVPWQIIKDDAEGILLLADENLDFQPYDDRTDWNGKWGTSSLKAWLENNFWNGESDQIIQQVWNNKIDIDAMELMGTIAPDGASNTKTAEYTAVAGGSNAQITYFTDAEKAAVVQSSLSNPALGAADVDDETTDDFIFPLAIDDVEAAYPTPADRPTTNTRYAASYPNTTYPEQDGWLTRSHSGFILPKYIQRIKGDASAFGEIAYTTARTKLPIRPALRLKRDAVVMVSSSKTSSINTTLQPVSSLSGDLKLTLVNDTYNSFTASAGTGATPNTNGYYTVTTGGSLNINYSGEPSTGGYVSCVLENGAGEIKYYTKLAQATGSGANVSVTFANVPEESYTLNVFYEIESGSNSPDYASPPIPFKVYVTGTTSAVAPVIETTSLPNSFVGKIYNDTVKLSEKGFPAPVFSYTGTLPTGLTLDPVTGRISGALTTEGTFTFTINVDNAAGKNNSKEYTVLVQTIKVPVILSNQAALESAGKHLAYVGIPYEYQLDLNDNTGGFMLGTEFAKNVTFTIVKNPDDGTIPLPGGLKDGDHPDGMELTPDGLIHGTPYQDETLTFTVQAETEGTFAYKTFTLSVLRDAGSLSTPPEFVTTSSNPSLDPPTATAGMPYTSDPILVTGSVPISFTFDATTFPQGLMFDPSSKRVKGTPQLAEGSVDYELKISATNQKATVSQTYKLTVAAPALPAFRTAELPAATQTLAYATTITADNATLVDVVSATTLPAGINRQINAGTLTLDGTPTVAGSYIIQAKATNSNGTITRDYELQVDPPLVPVITTPLPDMPQGTVGMPYDGAQLRASNSPTKWHWTGTPSTPSGLALGNNGVISGTPAQAGTYILTFTAENGVGRSTSRTDSITIKPQTMPVTSLTSRELPVGSSAQIQVGLGLPPTLADSVVIEITGNAIGSDTLYLLKAGTFTLNANRAGTSDVTVKFYSGGTLMPSAGKSYTIEVYSDPTTVSVARRVFIPAVEEAILSESGQCGVLSGRDFEFTIRPTGEQTGKVPVVTTDRQMSDGKKDVEVTRDATDRGLYHVRVLQVQSNVTLTITFSSESSNQLIQETKVWGGKETLHILPVLRGEAVIYGSTGERVAITPLEAGQEAIVPLPSGVYVVVLDGGVSFKAIVNSK